MRGPRPLTHRLLCTFVARQRILKPGGAFILYGSPAKLWISHLKIMVAEEFGLEFKQHISWVYKQGGDSRMQGMRAYSVRMEHVEWFVQPGAEHTFHAEAAAEHYEPEEMKEALAKGIGRVTEEALARGRPPKIGWRSRARTRGPRSGSTARTRR